MQQGTIEGFRLSPQQRRLWLLQDGNTAFRAQCALLVSGNLHLANLKSAVENLVDRHEILRTTFHSLPGMKFPVQVVGENRSYSWRSIDLSHLNEQDFEAEVEALWKHEKGCPFALDQGPLLHLTLVNRSAREHLLLINLPSICGDSWTLNNFVRQLADCYNASAGDTRAKEVIQYAQFSEWQNELLASAEAGARGDYWDEARPEEWPAPGLPYEMAGADAGRFAPERLMITVQPETFAKLSAAARRHRISVDGFLLAVWHTVIWRLAGGNEVVVGRVVPVGDHQMLADALGPFIKCVPTVARFNSLVPFTSIAHNLDSAMPAMIEALELFEISKYRRLGEATRPDEGGAAFFPYVFSFEERPGPIHAQELTLTFKKSYVVTEQFRAMVRFTRAEDCLEAEFLYDPARLRADDVRYLAARFEALLESASENPDAPVGEMEILGETERQRLLLDANSEEAIFRTEACLHEQFEEQVARTPEAVALVFGDEHLSYRELNERANKAARYLQRCGVECEARVGVLMERSVEMIWAVLGVLKAGGAYVPLDVTNPGLRVREMIEDTGADVVLTERKCAEVLEGAGVKLVRVDGAERDELERESGEAMSSRVEAGNLAYVIYTSGSTGKPKGVMVSHRSASNLAGALRRSVYEDLGRSLRVSLNAPLTFDASVKQLLQLLYGHSLHLLPEEVRYEAAALLTYGRRQQLDVLDCTPAQLRSLIAAGLLDERGVTFATVLVGGDALDEETWQLLARSTTTRFYNLYGPTECTVDATVCPIQPAHTRASLGRPVANARVYLLDPHLRPVPGGVAGEIYIGGDGVSRGYLGQPGLTAERFIPDLFSDKAGTRLYATGDLARYLWKDLGFLGRKDHQVKIRGFRIELGEIETVLKTHSALRDAVVVARDADSSGEKQLVAYAVSETPEKAATIAEPQRDLRVFLRQRLPEYMIPSAFVLLDAIPLTRHSKIDRAALTASDRRLSTEGENYVPPRNEIERSIAMIWREVLEIDRVGVRDNFFDLGGHSLLMARAYSKLRETIGQEFSMIDLFRYPTISSLAEFLSDGEGPRETTTREEIQRRAGKQRAAFRRQKDLAAGGKNG
jgi:amino acid adenylation domain-containing protein